MASPIRHGTSSSTAISSKEINILEEKIYVTIDSNFETARFIVDYYIYADKSGKQIPLLFDAADYKGDFKIFVDDKAIELQDISDVYKKISNTPFDNFTNSFKTDDYDSTLDVIEIKWDETSTSEYRIGDLKYFETELTKGEHHIHVEYIAKAWTDVSGWAKIYSFRYSLSPAKFWKSFGDLEITIDATESRKSIATNLGKQNFGKLDSIAIWNFTKLPADFIKIEYNPKLSKLSQILISIDAFGLMLVFGFLLTIIHILIIIKHRKNNLDKKFSLVVIIGSLIIPFIVLLSLMFFYDLIDNTIGKDAGRHHGYTFLSVLFYPLVMPIYWIFTFLIDKITQTIYKKKQNRL